MIIFSYLKEFFSRFFITLRDRKKVLAITLSLITIGLFFAIPNLSFAQETGGDFEEYIVRFFAWLFGHLILFFGEILLFLVKQVINFSTYNSFANSTAVVTGWVIVRDLVNMFFIVVLLIIAVATILNIESYSYKKMLGRLVLMAILVNFSKTIALLIIDFSQVIMMTFVNGFQAAAGGNFVQALGLNQIMNINVESGDISGGSVIIAYMLGIVMILISCVTVGMMLIILLMRMVMLWILIVLSPIAFFLSIIPQAQKYASQWWSMFTEYVLVGPILAFFLWLSLISVTTLSAADRPDPLEGQTGFNEQRVAISEIGGEASLQSFIIAIGMLIGGLVMTGKMGVIGAGIGVGVLKGAKSAGLNAARWGGKTVGKWGLARADDLQARGQKAIASSRAMRAVTGRLAGWGRAIGKGRGGRVPGFKALGTTLEAAEGARKALSIHGVAFRTVPAAWKERSQRKEIERLGESKAVAHDILSRALFFGKDKTDFAALERAARVNERQKKISEESDTAESLRSRLKSECLTNRGRVKVGKEADAEAIVKIMAANHDANELSKDVDIAKWHLNGNRTHNAKNLQGVLKGIFGDTPDAARIGSKVGQIALANKDSHLYYLATKNVERDEYEFVEDAKEQAQAAAAYTAKRTPRQQAVQATRQDFGDETVIKDLATGENKLNFSLSDNGREILRKCGGSMAKDWSWASEEAQEAVLGMLDEVKDFADTDLSLSQTQKAGIYRFMHEVKVRADSDKAKGSGKNPGDPLRVNAVAELDHVIGARNFNVKIASGIGAGVVRTGATDLIGNAEKKFYDLLVQKSHQDSAKLKKIILDIWGAADGGVNYHAGTAGAHANAAAMNRAAKRLRDQILIEIKA